jgi:hypothetical protein
MYEIPTLSGGGSCFIIAPMNSMLLASLHILSVPTTMQVNPLVPGRSVRMEPSFSILITAASLAIASGAAESACAVYSASETCASCALSTGVITHSHTAMVTTIAETRISFLPFD